MTPRPVAGRVPPRLTVTVVAGPRWRPHTRGLGRWLARAAPARARGRVVIALIDDRRMRQLNARFRGVDAPTDVLSFPADPAPPVGSTAERGRDSPKRRYVNELGDIAIARGVARRQAAAYGHALATEIRVLALHGLLHLMGYDHERDQGQMHRLEARLRRRTNLPAGLLSRAPAPRRRR
jgi:probable rRNA maturation factor